MQAGRSAGGWRRTEGRGLPERGGAAHIERWSGTVGPGGAPGRATSALQGRPEPTFPAWPASRGRVPPRPEGRGQRIPDPYGGRGRRYHAPSPHIAHRGPPPPAGSNWPRLPRPRVLPLTPPDWQVLPLIFQLGVVVNLSAAVNKEWFHSAAGTKQDGPAKSSVYSVFTSAKAYTSPWTGLCYHRSILTQRDPSPREPTEAAREAGRWF